MKSLASAIAITVVLHLALVSCPLGQAQVRGGGGGVFGISGRIIVPLAEFQDIFEVLLVQNLAQPVQATVADSQGRYRFAGIPRGIYYIMVKIDGFQEVRQRVDLNSESIVNIILDFEEERVVKAPTDFSGESLEVVDIVDLSKTYPPAVIEKLKSANKEIKNRNFARALPLLEEIVREVPDFYQAHRLLGSQGHPLLRQGQRRAGQPGAGAQGRHRLRQPAPRIHHPGGQMAPDHHPARAAGAA